MWSPPLRLIVVAAPAVLVGFLGSLYVKRCFDTLLSPNVGFKTSYSTPAGEVTISAANYAINLQVGTVWLDDLRVMSPTKKPLLMVSKIRATGIYANNLNPKVVVSGPQIYLERRANGSLDIQDLFDKQPKSKKE